MTCPSVPTVHRLMSVGVLLFVLWHLSHHPDADGGGALTLIVVKEVLYQLKGEK